MKVKATYIYTHNFQVWRESLNYPCLLQPIAFGVSFLQSRSLRLLCNVSLETDQLDWDWRMRVNYTPNAIWLQQAVDFPLSPAAGCAAVDRSEQGRDPEQALLPNSVLSPLWHPPVKSETETEHKSGSTMGKVKMGRVVEWVQVILAVRWHFRHPNSTRNNFYKKIPWACLLCTFLSACTRAFDQFDATTECVAVKNLRMNEDCFYYYL